MKSARPHQMTGLEIQAEAFAMFEAWLREQPEEVHKMDVLEQATRYYVEKCGGEK